MKHTFLLLLLFSLILPPGVSAEDKAGAAAAHDAAAQANNPIADFIVYGLQNYYIGDLTELENENANQFWLRYARPFSAGSTKWIMRASLPINTYPVAPSLDHETDLGDLNVLSAYLFDTGDPALSFGLEPQINAPTGDEDTLGSGKWSVGLVNALFDGRSKRFQYGYLASWWTSFAGDDDRADVNAGFLQPFAFFQLGGGTYLRAAPISSKTTPTACPWASASVRSSPRAR